MASVSKGDQFYFSDGPHNMSVKVAVYSDSYANGQLKDKMSENTPTCSNLYYITNYPY